MPTSIQLFPSDFTLTVINEPRHRFPAIMRKHFSIPLKETRASKIYQGDNIGVFPSKNTGEVVLFLPQESYAHWRLAHELKHVLERFCELTGAEKNAEEWLALMQGALFKEIEQLYKSN